MTIRATERDMARRCIERAREVDILNLAERLGAKLKRAGAREYVGPCPVCGGKDRFSVNIKKHLWNCRGCGKGGDVIGLAQHAGGATFAEAVAALGARKLARLVAARGFKVLLQGGA